MLRYYSNILATSVQKFRKELNLRSWNKIVVNFHTDSQLLIDSFNKYNSHIEKVVRNPVYLNQDMVDILAKHPKYDWLAGTGRDHQKSIMNEDENLFTTQIYLQK